MSDSIIQKRGMFWWVNDGGAASESASGVLSISSSGAVKLELDTSLSAQSQPKPGAPIRLEDLVRNDAIIFGAASGTGSKIVLSGVQCTSSLLTAHGVVCTAFYAKHCLIGPNHNNIVDEALGVDSISVGLEGLEDWIGLNDIEYSTEGDKISVSYETPKNIEYNTDFGDLLLIYDVYAPPLARMHLSELKLRQMASFNIKLNTPKSLDEAYKIYCLLQDLITILAGPHIALDWPRLSVNCACYDFYSEFHSRPIKHKLFERSNAWVMFFDLKECFGEIFYCWMQKRNELGPGFYLFLALLRGQSIFVENRFLNMITGLESMHRQMPTEVNSKLEEKIKRIINCVEPKKDKNWLEGRLKFAAEPTLDERLYSLISSLDIGLEEPNIRDFCKECASLRNEIAHFGRKHAEKSYDDFLLDAHIKSEALLYLYQSIILQTIGISKEIISRHLFRGYNSMRSRNALRAAGFNIDKIPAS